MPPVTRGWNLQLTRLADVAAKIYAENSAVGTKLAALATAVAAGTAPIDLIRPCPRAVQPIGLGIYQVQVLIFLMLVICMQRA